MQKSFSRSLNLSGGLALAISFIVGSGLLGLPGIVIQSVNPQYAALSWMVTSALMIPLVVVFSKLGSSFPDAAGGLLSYIEFAFGRAGRNAAALMLLACFGFGLPALLLIGGSYLQLFLGVDPFYTPALAIFILVFSITFNLLGLKSTTRFNSISVILLISFIVVLTALNRNYFWHGTKVAIQSLGIFTGGAPFVFSALWKGTTLIFWAYLGWENLSFGIQEFKDPKRTIPLIFGLSFLIVVILYLALAFTTIGAADLGVASVASPSGVISLLEGSVLKPIYLSIIVVLILGNANAWIYGGSRFFFAEAKEGLLPRSLTVLSAKQVPVRCLVFYFGAALVCIFACWGFSLPIADLILLVNQNFIFLFLACIWAYWKIEKSAVRFIIAPLSVVTCSLFLAGFNAWILFPVALAAIGVGIHYARAQ